MEILEDDMVQCR